MVPQGSYRYQVSVCVCAKSTLLRVVLVSGHVKFYTVNDVAFSPERCV